MKSPIDRIHARICMYLRSRFEMIKPEPAQGLFNFKCFDNAVEYNLRFPNFEVVEVIYIDGEQPLLHYINFEPSTNTYHETTLGYRIRRIHPDDYKYISHEFNRSLECWLIDFTNWFHRSILRIKRVV